MVFFAGNNVLVRGLQLRARQISFLGLRSFCFWFLLADRKRPGGSNDVMQHDHLPGHASGDKFEYPIKMQRTEQQLEEKKKTKKRYSSKVTPKADTQGLCGF